MRKRIRRGGCVGIFVHIALIYGACGTFFSCGHMKGPPEAFEHFEI